MSMLMSTLVHITAHVNADFYIYDECLCYVHRHVQAGCPCPGCMSMSMLHVYAKTARPCACRMSLVQAACPCPGWMIMFPCYTNMLHGHREMNMTIDTGSVIEMDKNMDSDTVVDMDTGNGHEYGHKAWIRTSEYMS
jgi:hypothetical protein